MKIARGAAGSSPNFPQIRDTIWPFRRVFSSHLLGASHKQFDELNTGNWYGYWTCYKEFYRTIPIKNENVEHHFCQNFLCFFPQESYLDVSGRIRAPGSKQLSSSFVSLMPTLPLSYFRAGLIGLATLRCWSEAVRNLRVFLCLWMSWSCFHLSLLTAHGPIGQGWSLEFQVWPSPIISLCLQLILRAKLDGGEQCSWRSWQTSTCEDLRVYADFSSEWGVNIKWYQVSTWSYMIHGSDWARCLFMLKWISHDIIQCEISQTCPVQPRCWRNRWQQTSSRNSWTKKHVFSEITWKYCF